MNSKRKRSLRLADGVAQLVPVSPFSLRGIGQAVGGAYSDVVDATSHGIEAVAKPFSRPAGYTPALASAPAPVAAPAAPAPPALQLGGMNLGVIQRREAAAGLADGTPYVSPLSLKGIGGSLRGSYDSLVGSTTDLMEAAHNRMSPPPGYTPALATPPVQAPTAPAAPADPAPTVGGAIGAIQARQQMLNNLADGTGMVRGPGGPVEDKVDAKLSRGESVLPADTTAAVGPENIQRLIDETHTPAHLQRQGVPPGGRHRGLRFANGIAGLDVSESPFTESDARLFNQRPAGTVPTPQPQVPGMTVSEPPTLTARVAPPAEIPGMRVSYPVTDPGPGNPNLGDRVGPPRPAGPTPLAEPAPTAVARPAVGAAGAAEGGGMAYRAGRLAATGLRAAPNMIIANELAQNLGSSKVSNDIAPVDSSAMGTLRYAANGDFANAGESLRKGAVEAGSDLLKAGAGVGDIFLPGTPLTDRLNARLRSDGAVTSPTPQPRAASPTAQPQTQTDAQRGGGTAPPLNNSVLPGGAQAGQIQRRGNSYTNTGTFAEDASPGSISPQNDRAATALDARSRASGLRGSIGADQNLPAGYGTTIPGVNAPASQYETELAARNASVRSMDEDRGMNANQRALARSAERQDATTRRGQDFQDATTRRGQDVNAEVARAGNRVTLRGQDLNYDSTTRGQDVSSRTAYQKARQDQFNADRSYQFDVAKHGDEVAKQRFEMRQTAEKGVHEQIANMLPPGPDGKPDMANAARYATGLNAIVAQHQQALQQRAAQGDKGAAAALEDLSRNGLAALDQGTVRNFVNGMKSQDLSDQYATSRFNPVGGTGTITDTPPTGLRKTSNGFLGFGGEYSALDANGRPTGATIPARAVEGDGSFFGGKRRTDLRDFIR